MKFLVSLLSAFIEQGMFYWFGGEMLEEVRAKFMKLCRGKITSMAGSVNVHSSANLCGVIIKDNKQRILGFIC